jgi:hypothetical protein
MNPIWSSVLTVLGTVGVAILALAVPVVRLAVGKYVAGFVSHHFDRQIEELKSDLRRSEEKLASELRANEQQLRSLTEVALSLRTTRQAALDARRLMAVEKLWAAKIATDRMKSAAMWVSYLNLEEVFKAAERGDQSTQSFGGVLDKLAGVDLEKDIPPASALAERPFLTLDVWVAFSAYQSVITHSVIILKAIASGTTEFLKKEDILKPLMLLALPEYKSYIEEYGFSGYYHLLEVLEQKLLNAIAEMLDGKAIDAATLKRSAEIMAAARDLNAEAKPEIPNALRGSEIPEPPNAV